MPDPIRLTADGEYPDCNIVELHMSPEMKKGYTNVGIGFPKPAHCFVETFVVSIRPHLALTGGVTIQMQQAVTNVMSHDGTFIPYTGDDLNIADGLIISWQAAGFAQASQGQNKLELCVSRKNIDPTKELLTNETGDFWVNQEVNIAKSAYCYPYWYRVRFTTDAGEWSAWSSPYKRQMDTDLTPPPHPDGAGMNN